MPDVVSLSWMAIEEYVPRRLRTSCGDVDADRSSDAEVRLDMDIRHVVLTDAVEDVVVKLDVELVVELEELLDVVVVP